MISTLSYGILTLSLLLSILCASNFSAAEERKEGEIPYTISLHVDQVMLDVSVLESGGRFVSGLEATDFKVFEDERLQEIVYFASKDVPVTIGLVIDNSGSMRSKRPEIITAAMSFINASNPNDEIFVIHFNERVRFGLQDPASFASDPLLLRSALYRMTADGKTALYDAISQAVQHLTTGKCDRKALVVVSDGGDNASRRDLPEVLRLIQSTHAAVYTLTVYDPNNKDQNPKVLRRLAKISGGESFFPKELKQVGPICQTIATDIRNQYLLAYRPTNSKRDGSFRHLRVAVESPRKKKLAVRTREGYVAPLDLESEACQASP